MLLTDLVHQLNTELRITEIPDYPPALNGLQVDAPGMTVRKIATAVDATLHTIRRAIEQQADLLIVHHGLFWNGQQPITAATYEKLRLCIQHPLAIYSSHLPLDVHPSLGNNACIAQALNLTPSGSFLPFKNQPIGVICETEIPLPDLHHNLIQALEGSPVHLCPGGPTIARRIGISSGGSGSEVAAAAAAGVDTFITGEGPHWSYTLAEELGINVLYGGHYATETFGVKALATWIQQQHHIPWSFIHHPTGL